MLTEENMRNRKKGIGASDCAAAMGLNPYMTPYQLWRLKTGRDEAQPTNDLQLCGQLHEETVSKLYEIKKKVKLRKVIRTLYHKYYPFILCHLDRKINGMKKFVECKFARFVMDTWGESGSDIIPDHYYMQVQHCLAITGYKEADLAVLIGGYDFRTYTLPRNEPVIEKIIHDLTYFWGCVETDTPPEIQTHEDVLLAYPRNDGNFKDPNDNFMDLVTEYKQERQKSKFAASSMDLLRDKISVFISGSDGVRYEDKILATMKADKNGKRILRVNE